MTFETLKKLDSGAGSTLGDYKFLYGFVSLIRPKKIIEIGTNFGLSAIAMAMALRDEGLTESRIVSIDINPDVLKMAKQQLEQVSLLKYVTLIHGDSSIVESYPQIDMVKYITLIPRRPSKVEVCPPFDMAFIDGEHAYEDCLADFNRLKNRATYILIHDSMGNGEIERVVETIADTGKYDVFNLDVGNAGKQWKLGKVVFRSYPGFTIIKEKI